MNEPKKINDGGAAFPTVHHDTSQGIPYQYTERGMELRDYFAAKAMQGIITSPNIDKDAVKEARDVAMAAYEMADAMIGARSTEPVKA